MRTELDPLGADVGYTSPYAYNMTYSDIMGSDNLYSIRGNALDIRGGCTLDGMSIACNEAMEAVRSGTAQEVVLVSHYVTAKLNGQIVFRGYAGVSYVPRADMWRSEITTPVEFTPEQLAEHSDEFGNQSFWAGMLNGSIGFNGYGATTYSDDVGTHDITTPYNVSIYGGAAYVSSQSPALAERAAKNCATPNSVVAYFRKDFEAQWERTTQSGEENGSLIFYEQATNKYHKVTLSQGRHLGSDPALPEVGPETRKAFDDFRNAKQEVYFFAFFHTHPNYPHSGDSRSGDPSGGDIQYQSDYRNVLGIIRTGKGYSFFSNGRTFWPNDARANECIWTLNHRRN